jgi:hypothetical protein
VVEALRTPDDRFRGLPGWDHPPSYVEDLPGYEGLRIHYVDLGPRDAVDTYLLLHGEPTWAFLYRKMIPVFMAAGGRAGGVVDRREDPSPGVGSHPAAAADRLRAPRNAPTTTSGTAPRTCSPR